MKKRRFQQVTIVNVPPLPMLASYVQPNKRARTNAAEALRGIRQTRTDEPMLRR